MNVFDEAKLRLAHLQTRRHFLKSFSAGLGGAALASLGLPAMELPGSLAYGSRNALGGSVAGAPVGANSLGSILGGPLSPRPPHFAPAAKHVIFLH